MTKGNRKMCAVAFLLTAALSTVDCGGGSTAGSNTQPPPPPPPTKYTVGGAVFGLRGTGLVVQDNAQDSLTVTGNGSFSFPTPVTAGDAYNVTVLTQPSNPQQNCVITNGSGKTPNSNVTNVVLGCVGMWTWVNGSNIQGDPGVSGTQGMASVGNIPGARNYASGSTDAAGNFWLFGGSGYPSSGLYGWLDDLWEFGPNGWAWLSGSQLVPSLAPVYGTLGVPAPTNDPGIRVRAVTWIDASGNFWLFGGGGLGAGPGSTGWLNDLWRYSAGEWTWIGGPTVVDQTAEYGTLGVSAPSNIPGARDSAARWTDAAGNFWLFGGNGFDSDRATDYGWLNDLWTYSAGEWTWIGGTDEQYQSGVYGTQGVPAATNILGSRIGAATWTDENGGFWLFGGLGNASAGSSGFLNDLWKYSGGQWTWVSGSNIAGQSGIYGNEGEPEPGNTPGARQYAVSWIDGSGSMWLFGGSDLGGNFNDIWRYAAGQWTWMGGSAGSLQKNEPGVYGIQGTAAPTNQPGARQQAVCWIDSKGTLWLFGGDGYDSTGVDGPLNDQWKYEP
jgi:hypothetical protein